MIKLMIALLALTALGSGCAGLALTARDRVDCYIPRLGATHGEPRTDMASCLSTSVLPHQYQGCMVLKGYDLGECYADNNQPVRK